MLNKYLIMHVIPILTVCVVNTQAATLHVGSGQIYTTIQEAVDVVNGGDTILIHEGLYIEDVDIDNKQTTAGNEIILSPYATDTVIVTAATSAGRAFWLHGTTDYWIINGKNQMTVNGGVSADGAIRLAQSDGDIVGVQIKNITINGNNTSGAGIIMRSTDDCLVQGVTIQGLQYRGIEGSNAGTAPSVGACRLTVRFCTFINPGYAGVEASGTSYWLVECNYFYRDLAGGQHLIVHRGGNFWKIQNNIFEVRAGGALNSIAVLRSDADYSGYNIQNEIYMNNTFATTGGTVSNGYGVVFLAWNDVSVYEIQNSRFQNNLFIGDWGTSNGMFQFGSGGPVAENCFVNYNRKTASDTDSPWGNPNGWTIIDNSIGLTNYQASGNKPSPFFDLTESYDGSSANDPPMFDYDVNLRGVPPDVSAFEYEEGWIEGDCLQNALSGIYYGLDLCSNPVRSKVVIHYHLSQRIHVNLAIYDATGSIVTELINNTVTRGYHKIIWRADKLVPGIYFIRLGAGDYNAVKKIVVIGK